MLFLIFLTDPVDPIEFLLDPVVSSYSDESFFRIMAKDLFGELIKKVDTSHNKAKLVLYHDPDSFLDVKIKTISQCSICFDHFNCYGHITFDQLVPTGTYYCYYNDVPPFSFQSPMLIIDLDLKRINNTNLFSSFFDHEYGLLSRLFGAGINCKFKTMEGVQFSSYFRIDDLVPCTGCPYAPFCSAHMSFVGVNSDTKFDLLQLTRFVSRRYVLQYPHFFIPDYGGFQCNDYIVDLCAYRVDPSLMVGSVRLLDKSHKPSRKKRVFKDVQVVNRLLERINYK